MAPEGAGLGGGRCEEGGLASRFAPLCLLFFPAWNSQSSLLGSPAAICCSVDLRFPLSPGLLRAAANLPSPSLLYFPFLFALLV